MWLSVTFGLLFVVVSDPGGRDGGTLSPSHLHSIAFASRLTATPSDGSACDAFGIVC